MYPGTRRLAAMLRPIGTDIASNHFDIRAGHMSILPYALSRGDPLTEQACCGCEVPNASSRRARFLPAGAARNEPGIMPCTATRTGTRLYAPAVGAKLATSRGDIATSEPMQIVVIEASTTSRERSTTIPLRNHEA
jgi:hypothetical protein